MDGQFLLMGLCILREDTSLYATNITILKIFFITGLALLLLFLHHTRPLTPLAIFLLLLTIFLCKALWDFFFICFFVCPCLWTLIIFLSYAWWYLQLFL